MNSNWEEEFDVPFGPDNYFAFSEPRELDDLARDDLVPAEVDQGQPTHFYPRRNPFLFTIRVPADFGEQELVWTLTTHGRKNRAYASLRADYRMDPQVMSTEVGVYRTQFFGHRCNATGPAKLVRLAGLDRRVVPELLEPPGRVVPLHERGHCGRVPP